MRRRVRLRRWPCVVDWQRDNRNSSMRAAVQNEQLRVDLLAVQSKGSPVSHIGPARAVTRALQSSANAVKEAKRARAGGPQPFQRPARRLNTVLSAWRHVLQRAPARGACDC